MSQSVGIDITNANFTVKLNGQPLSDAYTAYLKTACVSDDIRGLSMAEVRIGIWSTLANAFINIDDGDFDLGGELEVLMGYGGEMTTVFTGEIVSQVANFSATSPHSVTVRAYDKGHRLTQGKKVRNFAELKDSEIVEKIIREAGLTPSVEDTGTVIPQVIQNNMTDMEFIRTRARRYGYRVYTEGDTCYFVNDDLSISSSVTFTYGVDFVEFTPTISLAEPITEVEVRGWDSINKQSLTGTAAQGSEAATMGGSQTGSQLTGAAFGDQKIIVTNLNVYNAAQSQSYAESVLKEHSRNLIKAKLVVGGNTALKAGQVITLEGLTNSFNGDYYIESSNHSMTTGIFTTTLELQRNAS